MRKYFLLLALIFITPLFAAIIQNVRGIVHDPQHRPIEGAQVEIHAKASEWSQRVKTNANGEFQFDSVPVGQYVITVTSDGFNKIDQALAVTTEPVPVIHFPMTLAGITQTVEVSAT